MATAKKKEPKRIYRSEKDKMISGVCGGLGEYLNVDPTLIRLAWVAVTVFTAVAPGVLAYLIAAVIIPAAPDNPESK